MVKEQFLKLLNNFSKDLVPLGKIIKPHGINGELKVFLYNSKSETFVEGLEVWFNIADKYQCYKLNSIRGSINNKIIQIVEISNIDKATSLIKKDLYPFSCVYLLFS